MIVLSCFCGGTYPGGKSQGVCRYVLCAIYKISIRSL